MKLKQSDIKEIMCEASEAHENIKELKCAICKKRTDCDAVPLSLACTFATDRTRLSELTTTLNMLLSKE